MLYFAHRGLSARFVQNTAAAFRAARAAGAICYELDVHLLKDGALAVHHDYSLSPAAGGEVSLAELSSADLKKYPLENPFSSARAMVPLLAEILPLVRPQLVCLNIELKNDDNRYPGVERALLDLLQQQAPDLLAKTLFSSFDYETLVRLRNLDKKARIGLLTRKFDVSQALALGAESVHLNYTRFTREVAEICHANQLKVYLYTVNDFGLAAQVEASGADGIFTDAVDQFL